ncbi:MAG: hypothetical protein M3O22_01710 [Pseudomonadota bacterium]|nr:hypothetical protein [Pseudomonadota bacterium]
MTGTPPDILHTLNTWADPDTPASAAEDKDRLRLYWTLVQTRRFPLPSPQEIRALEGFRRKNMPGDHKALAASTDMAKGLLADNARFASFTLDVRLTVAAEMQELENIHQEQKDRSRDTGYLPAVLHEKLGTVNEDSPPQAVAGVAQWILSKPHKDFRANRVLYLRYLTDRARMDDATTVQALAGAFAGRLHFLASQDQTDAIIRDIANTVAATRYDPYESTSDLALETFQALQVKRGNEAVSRCLGIFCSYTLDRSDYRLLSWMDQALEGRSEFRAIFRRCLSQDLQDVAGRTSAQCPPLWARHFWNHVHEMNLYPAFRPLLAGILKPEFVKPALEQVNVHKELMNTMKILCGLDILCAAETETGGKNRTPLFPEARNAVVRALEGVFEWTQKPDSNADGILVLPALKQIAYRHGLGNIFEGTLDSLRRQAALSRRVLPPTSSAIP